MDLLGQLLASHRPFPAKNQTLKFQKFAKFCHFWAKFGIFCFWRLFWFKIDQMWQDTIETLAFKKEALLFCLFQSSFFFPKWRKQNKETRSDVFFPFCILLCWTKKKLFFFTIVQINKPLVKKKRNSFSCLRNWKVTFLQKRCEHQRFVTKSTSNGQFHFFCDTYPPSNHSNYKFQRFWTPTHLSRIKWFRNVP